MDKGTKIKISWFIAYFVLAMCINTYVPNVQNFTPFIVRVAKAGLVLTLFLIGAGLSIEAIRQVGAKILIIAILLWIFISCTSLLMIMK